MSGQKDYDVVIVGSGIAGALMAYRLASAGLQVLVLEAGAGLPDQAMRDQMVLAFKRSASKAQNSPYAPLNLVAPQPSADAAEGFGRDYYVETGGEDKSKLFMSYYERLSGGATWHWQGLNLRMLPSDFKMKTLYGVGADWPIDYDELESWYCDAEYETGTSGNHEELNDLHSAWRSKPFPMRAIAASYGDSVFRRALEGAQLDGIPVRITTVPQARNSVEGFDGRPACNGQGSCIPLCPSRAKYEATFHLEKAVAAGAELRPHAIVTRLDCEVGGAVTNVHYKAWNMSEHDVSGKVVVLAANAIEIPKLLLMSNHQFPKGVANASGAVGRYLMDHPIKMSYALAREPVFPYRGPPSTSSIETYRDGDFRGVRGAFRTTLRNDGWSWPTGAPRGTNRKTTGTLLDFVGNRKLFGTRLRTVLADHMQRQLVVNSAVEQLPEFKNRIYPSTTQFDRFGVPRPVIEYEVDDYTREAFKKALELHRLIFEQVGVVPGEGDLQDNPTVDAGSGHVMGTTRMGDDPASSVVDRDCKCHDHRNLFIVGSSVFPTGATANPTLTIAALALRAAGTIQRLMAQPAGG